MTRQHLSKKKRSTWFRREEKDLPDFDARIYLILARILARRNGSTWLWREEKDLLDFGGKKRIFLILARREGSTRFSRGEKDLCTWFWREEKDLLDFGAKKWIYLILTQGSTWFRREENDSWLDFDANDLLDFNMKKRIYLILRCARIRTKFGRKFRSFFLPENWEPPSPWSRLVSSRKSWHSERTLSSSFVKMSWRSKYGLFVLNWIH
jgi:hypothetical protein